jgi:catechol 2,3-dioxygenase-like lactoylglutathione lyase family enzyme
VETTGRIPSPQEVILAQRLPLSVLETALYVHDLAAAERFYRDVLGLPFDSREDGRHVFFRCGDAMLLIFDPDVTAVKLGHVPTHGARGPGHVAFSIGDGEFQPWLDRLAEHGVELEASIDWPTGGGSIYFRDPRGNSVELTTPRIWGIG